MSGSYSGGLSFFKGLADGTFGAEVKLARDGKPLTTELAPSPCLGDWSGTGRLDLVVGFVSGPVRLYRNLGGLTFAEGEPFTTDGEPLTAGDGGPCLVDWDGDGVLDLVIGDDVGNVVLYRGRRKGGTDLEKGAFLIPEVRGDEAWRPARLDPESPTGLSRLRPGMRVKPWVADWNGDGKLDLMVGDFLTLQGDAPILTPEQQAEKARFESEREGLGKRLAALQERVVAAALKASGLTPEEARSPENRERFGAAYAKAVREDRDFREVEARFSELDRELARLGPPTEMTGFVWVYLRK